MFTRLRVSKELKSMDNRIEQKFKKLKSEGKKGLITFLTAGDPDLETTFKIVEEMIDNGIDLLEIGIPFSDPLAEGPTIEKASYRGLESGTTTDDVFQLVRRIRGKHDLPVMLMLYVNLIYKYGIDRFMKESKGAGIDGLIIPDISFEEAGEFKKAAEEANLMLINLVAPPTKEGRLEKITGGSRGFIYCVSSLGVTGTRQNITTDLKEFYKRLRQHTDLPLALGFGISGRKQIEELEGDWDAYIVGSAIVNLIAEHGKNAPFHVGRFIRELKGQAF